MKRTVFHSFPKINGSDVMERTEFYRWLERTPEGMSKESFTDAIFCYLYQFGFRFYAHILTPGQINNHRYTYSHYQYRNRSPQNETL